MDSTQNKWPRLEEPKQLAHLSRKARRARLKVVSSELNTLRRYARNGSQRARAVYQMTLEGLSEGLSYEEARYLAEKEVRDAQAEGLLEDA